MTVTSFGDGSSVQNHAGSSVRTQGFLETAIMATSSSIPDLLLLDREIPDDVTEKLSPVNNDSRRGSVTPSLARSEEADVAVIQGYAEPHAFRLLRRQNDESSIQALEKALKDDPTMGFSISVEGAPSRRPTALGIQSMQ